MKMLRTSAVCTAAAMIGAFVLLPAAAHAQGSCKWYGATALKQQQQNEKMKCGFQGPAWHSDLGAHMQWCTSVPPDVWKSSAQERDKMLADCQAKG